MKHRLGLADLVVRAVRWSEHPLDDGAGPREELASLVIRRRHQHGPEELAGDAEREVVLELRPTRAHDSKVAGGRPRCGQQARLADSCWAFDQKRAAATLARRGETISDSVELALSL